MTRLTAIQTIEILLASAGQGLIVQTVVKPVLHPPRSTEAASF